MSVELVSIVVSGSIGCFAAAVGWSIGGVWVGSVCDGRFVTGEYDDSPLGSEAEDSDRSVCHVVTIGSVLACRYGCTSSGALVGGMVF